MVSGLRLGVGWEFGVVVGEGLCSACTGLKVWLVGSMVESIKVNRIRGYVT